ncbi:hypothetical protein NCHU2750_32830 [Neorhizobium sp. NCHU2750]|nr:hypothetical protein NCHU2750_32830 [Neorhizobium sp. NCHU2750]
MCLALVVALFAGGDVCHFRCGLFTLGGFGALARLTARTGCGSTAAARGGLRLGFFLDHDLGRRAFDHRLRTGAILDDRSRNLGSFRHLRRDRSLRLGGTLGALATVGTILATLAALVAIPAVFARLLLLATLGLVVLALTILTLRVLALSVLLAGFTLLTLFATLLRFIDHRLRCVAQIVAITTVEVVLIDRIAVTFLMLEAILHLGLGCCDDAVVMFGVLQIVFRHDAVT